jgi:hypothetical protein
MWWKVHTTWRGGLGSEVEGAAALLAAQRRGAFLALFPRDVAQVLEAPAHGHLLEHHLQRPCRLVVDEDGAQRRMPAHQLAPAAFQARHVERAAQAVGDLLSIGQGVGLEQPLEEHPLLHRRQGVEVLQVLALDHLKRFSRSSTESRA